MRIALELGMGDTGSPDVFAPALRAAEECGFSTVWVGEHIVFFAEAVRDWPYKRGDEVPILPEDLPVTNPFAWLAYAAAVTSTIRLGTGVTLATLYHPLLLGKLAASVDHLSCGRLAFGVGVGWVEEEYRQLQMPYEDRGARVVEYIEAIREMWTSSPASYHGEYVNIDRIVMSPRPTQTNVPFIYGGNTRAALRRAAAHCEGLYLYNLSVDEIGERVQQAHGLLAETARSDEAFEIIARPVGDTNLRHIDGLIETGIDEVVLPYELIAAEQALSSCTVPEAIARLAKQWIG